MMIDMPRPRPPHLHCEPSRHGQLRWYVRVGHGPRIRLTEQFGTDEFNAAYQAAVTGKKTTKKGPEAGTLAWLLERYRETDAWTKKLSPATRRQRDNIFVHVLASAGHQQASKITKATIEAGKERRASTPNQARNFLDAMRGLFRWAVKAKHVRIDPTDGVENPDRDTGDGFMPWTEEHVAAYEAKWPLKTPQRVWLDVLLYTGLRRGDAVQLGPQHVRDGLATIKTEKTGIVVTLPILPVLANTLKAGPTGEASFIVGVGGKPLTKESFGNLFREACKKAGVPGSAHGVRKIAATRAANAGATVAQLEAIFGWQGGAMASLYTRSADRRRLSIEAAHKLANSIPSPAAKVRDSEAKDK